MGRSFATYTNTKKNISRRASEEDCWEDVYREGGGGSGSGGVEGGVGEGSETIVEVLYSTNTDKKTNVCSC